MKPRRSNFPKQHIFLLRTKILIRIIILMVFFSRKMKVLETRLTIEENSCGKNTLHLNILRRISISETLAPRTGNSFLRSENSFQQVMKQRVPLERMLNCNFRNSCYKSREFFSQLKRILVRNENSFQQAVTPQQSPLLTMVMQRVLLEIIFNRKSYEQNCNFRNSCHKNPEFFFSRTRILSSRQRGRGFFWRECLIADLMKRIAISEFMR